LRDFERKNKGGGKRNEKKKTGSREGPQRGVNDAGGPDPSKKKGSVVKQGKRTQWMEDAPKRMHERKGVLRKGHQGQKTL